VATRGGSGASSRDIRAGGAFVEIFAKDSLLRKGLAAAEKRVAQTGSLFAEIGKKSLAVGSVILAPLGAVFMKAVDGAAQLDDLADAFSTTTEKLSPLAYAFKVAGLGLEDLEKAMKEVAKNDASGRPLEDVLTEWALALNGIEDPGERARKALDQFGKAGLKIASIAPDLARLMNGAPIISSDDAKNAEKFQQETAKIGVTLEAALLPAVGWMAMMAGQASEWAKNNVGLVSTIAMIGGGLIAAGLAAISFGVALKGVALALAIVSAALAVTGGAVAFLLSPIGLVVTAVGGLITIWATMTSSGQSAMSRLGGMFRGLSDTAVRAWGGIMAAIEKGDLVLAFEVVSKGVRLIWLTLLEYLEGEWDKFQSGWKQGLRELFNEVVRLAIEAKKRLLDLIPKKDDWRIAIRDSLGLDENKPASDEDIRKFKSGPWNAVTAPWRNPADESIGGIFAALTRAMNLTPREQAEANFEDALRRALAPAVVQAAKQEAGSGSKVNDKLMGLPDQVKGMFGAINTKQAFGYADENAQNRQLKAMQEVRAEVKLVGSGIAAAVGVLTNLLEVEKNRKAAAFQ